MPTTRPNDDPSSIGHRPSSPSPAQAFQDLFDAYDNVLSSIRGYDGKPAQATELERIALMNRIRKRLAINARMPPGYNGALTVKEAAHRLGVTRKHVYALIKEGRLNGVLVDRKYYIPPEEVRAYKHDQDLWAAAGGRWTPYGRMPLKGPSPRYLPEGESDEDPGNRSVEPWHPPTERRTPNADAESPDHPVTQSPDQHWITTTEAAAILGITRAMVLRIARARGLESRLVRQDHGHPENTFRPDDIIGLAADREALAWKRGTSPKQWRDDLLHPIVRTTVQAPPGDMLLTRAEAAEILGVTPSHVTTLVKRGRLFGWQRQPGKSGVPLYLSANQVNRYANDPMRIKRRIAKLEGSAPSELKTGNDWTEWLEWHNLINRTGPSTQPDRGDMVNTVQAAEILGVAPRTVRQLRQKGRLRGYRSTRTRRHTTRSWWFFRRDDLEDPLADLEYAKHRRAAQQALATERARKNEPRAIISSRYRCVTK